MKKQKELRYCDKCAYRRKDGWCTELRREVKDTDYCSFGPWESEKRKGDGQVKTHLQIINTWASFALKNDTNFFTPAHMRDIARWTDDAIDLINEQEERIAIMEEGNGGTK